LLENQNGKRESLVVMRERDGRTLSVVSSEHGALPMIESKVEQGSTLYADDAGGWEHPLHEKFLTKRINHQECYSEPMKWRGARIIAACTTAASISLLPRRLLAIRSRANGKATGNAAPHDHARPLKTCFKKVKLKPNNQGGGSES
jgi:hypothetical protein